MAKFTGQPSRFATPVVGPRLASAFKDRFEARRVMEHWRRWYNLARWCAEPNGLRWQILLRDLFTCQMCGVIETDTSQLVADHKTPHRGDPELFWDENNLWCLCAGCHNTVKQAEERAGGR